MLFKPLRWRCVGLLSTQRDECITKPHLDEQTDKNLASIRSGRVNIGVSVIYFPRRPHIIVGTFEVSQIWQ